MRIEAIHIRNFRGLRRVEMEGISFLSTHHSVRSQRLGKSLLFEGLALVAALGANQSTIPPVISSGLGATVRPFAGGRAR